MQSNNPLAELVGEQVAQHEGVTLDPLSEHPCFVAITVAREGFECLRSPFRSGDLMIVEEGELYRTQGEAARRTFG